MRAVVAEFSIDWYGRSPRRRLGRASAHQAAASGVNRADYSVAGKYPPPLE